MRLRSYHCSLQRNLPMMRATRGAEGCPVPAGIAAVTPSAHVFKEFDANRLSRRLSAVIAADSGAIALFIDQIMLLLQENDGAETKGFDIEMALREALANAVLHGC